MEHIVILTGAGLSAESGLGTFRDKEGLWTRYNIDEVATPQGFARNPKLVHEFYNARRANCRQAQPNPAHTALADLQHFAPDRVTLITQNVDDLLERAGASGVIHMHGLLTNALCANCGHRWAAPEEMRITDACPSCGQCSTRPDVVWFGEIPYYMQQIEDALATADLFVAIGTSGNVYPAAGFVQDASARGARTLELNLENSATTALFDETRLGPASVTVPEWVAEIRQ